MSVEEFDSFFYNNKNNTEIYDLVDNSNKTFWFNSS